MQNEHLQFTATTEEKKLLFDLAAHEKRSVASLIRWLAAKYAEEVGLTAKTTRTKTRAAA